MPRILDLKEIDGAVWARVGEPGDFPSGIALWTPDEVEQFRQKVVRGCVDAFAEAVANAGKVCEAYVREDGNLVCDKCRVDIPKDAMVGVCEHTGKMRTEHIVRNMAFPESSNDQK